MVGALRKIAFGLVIAIVASVGMCTAETKMITADPAVQPALAQAKTDAQPLLAALDAYHATNGFYPPSVSDLAVGDANARNYTYETYSINRVYKSLACAGQGKSLAGWHKSPGAYKKQEAAFRSECLSGYSSFVLKSPRIATKWPINSSTVVFAKFTSLTAEWGVGWCNHSSRGGYSGDCGAGAD